MSIQVHMNTSESSWVAVIGLYSDAVIMEWFNNIWWRIGNDKGIYEQMIDKVLN